MADDAEDAGDAIQEVLTTGIATMIEEVGRGVAAAQENLALSQIASIDAMPQALRDNGYIPTFYQMQDVSVELKLAMHLSEERTEEGGRRGRFRLAPVNAEYTARSGYDVRGSSTLSIRFAPSPPPVSMLDTGSPVSDTLDDGG